MSDFESEPEGWRGLSFSKPVITTVLAVGFGVGLLAGWLGSFGHDSSTAASRAQQATATIMPDPPSLLTNMPTLSEAGEPPAADVEADGAAEAPPPAAAAPAPVPTPPPKPVAVKPEPIKPEPVSLTVAKPAAAKPHPAKHPAATVAPPAGSGRWVVQLGVFHEEDHAKLLLVGLTARGYAAEITIDRNAAGEPLYCVRSGHYPSRAVATTASREIAKRAGVSTYVTELPAAAS
jgi:cell division septation protein DedD